jgi:hypothetical protein
MHAHKYCQKNYFYFQSIFNCAFIGISRVPVRYTLGIPNTYLHLGYTYTLGIHLVNMYTLSLGIHLGYRYTLGSALMFLFQVHKREDAPEDEISLSDDPKENRFSM